MISMLAKAALCLSLLIFTPAILCAGPNADGVLFVNKAHTGGSQTGDSWSNAITELGTALDMARSRPADTVSQVWVAQGTYAPTTLPSDFQMPEITLTDRDKAFILVKDVSIYGGFTGTESTTASRTLPNTATVLSGDIGTLSDNSDNTYHVVVAAGDTGTAVLDGLTIMGGNADSYNRITSINGGEIYCDTGGGLYIYDASPLINNILITKNYAQYEGGAIYMNNSSSKIQNITISDNECDTYGAGIAASYSIFPITNALITGNRGNEYGFAIDANVSIITLTNGTISGNRGTHIDSTAISSIYDDSDVNLRNCMVTDNIDGYGNQAHTGIYENGTIDFVSSIIGDKFYDATGTALTPSNIAAADLFVDPQSATSAPTSAGDYHLKPGAYAINAGNNIHFDPGQTPDLSDITVDLDQNTRIIPPHVDLGPYEYGSTSGVADWGLYY